MTWFRRLPVVLKLLVPFVALILIVGAAGAFLIVRDLSSRAQATLNESLLQSSLRARAVLNGRELSLLESANLAANLEGMTEAVRQRRSDRTARLLRSVVALKEDLALVAATTPSGVGLAEFTRDRARAEPERDGGTRWGRWPFVAEALRGQDGSKTAGMLPAGGAPVLAIAAPVCSRVTRCSPVGGVIVGLPIEELAAEVAGNAEGRSTLGKGLTIFDPDGRVLAATGLTPGEATRVRVPAGGLVRRTETVGEREVHTLYAPFEIRGRPAGMVAVTIPAGPAFSSVRGAAWRLVSILLIVLAGIVAAGALVSRLILRQVRPLLETNRALGRGDLSARAEVVSDDEIGEVARGLNQMAEQLQASHETLEMRVSQRTEQVERLLRQRTEFFASLSHELRTPLAVILGETDILLDGPSPASGREATTTIKRSASQLLAVVNDILDLAKAEVGELEVDLSEVSLQEVVEDLRSTIEGLARGGQHDAVIDVPHDLPPVLADRERLGEIIINLVDNAVKYAPSGGRIELSARGVEDRVLISVSDTGPGIPEEDGERIFEPFYRVKGTKPARGRSSSGLGLALTRRLVQAHGGEIRFESPPGEGTTFTFTLSAARRLAPRLS